MRPDRIIVGEVRGAETLDMLQAMNTGHDGSLTTIHANTPRDALHRLEMLVLMAGIELPLQGDPRADRGAASTCSSTSARLVDGSRRVTQITEIVRHGGRRRDPSGSARRPRAREGAGGELGLLVPLAPDRVAAGTSCTSSLANGVELPSSAWLGHA